VSPGSFKTKTSSPLHFVTGQLCRTIRRRISSEVSPIAVYQAGIKKSRYIVSFVRGWLIFLVLPFGVDQDVILQVLILNPFLGSTKSPTNPERRFWSRPRAVRWTRVSSLLKPRPVLNLRFPPCTASVPHRVIVYFFISLVLVDQINSWWRRSHTR